MAKSISNRNDVIDSRDLEERIEELRSELEDDLEGYSNAWDRLETGPESDNESELEELAALEDFAEEFEGAAPDYRYGAIAVHGDYFEDYCKELLQDIGDIPAPIPGYIVIDWEGTAENLKVDYTEIDFDGTTYLVR